MLFIVASPVIVFMVYLSSDNYDKYQQYRNHSSSTELIPVLRKVYYNLKKRELELELQLSAADPKIVEEYILNQVYQGKYEQLPELLSKLPEQANMISKLKAMLPKDPMIQKL